MGMFLFIVVMAICTGMVVYGVVTFTVRFRRQRRRSAMASARLNPADIEVMVASAPEPVATGTTGQAPTAFDGGSGPTLSGPR